MNGIQAIPSAGQLRVTLSREHVDAVVQVSDTGRGISAEALPRIFKPFFTTRTEGTGLGLSLASSIVQSHGGRIEVTSSPGKGSQFRVWLPIRRPHKSAPTSTC